MEKESLSEIMLDSDLAALGDSLVNLVYSLALTRRAGRPKADRVGNKLLAEAVRQAGLRAILPKRLDRQAIGNSAEALLAYAWLEKLTSVEEAAELLTPHLDQPVEAFAQLIAAVVERIRMGGKGLS